MYQPTLSSLHRKAIHAIKILPEEKLPVLIKFAEFLNSSPISEKESVPDLSERRKRIAGKLKGQIWIADDFNETPDCFKDYL